MTVNETGLKWRGIAYSDNGHPISCTFNYKARESASKALKRLIKKHGAEYGIVEVSGVNLNFSTKLIKPCKDCGSNHFVANNISIKKTTKGKRGPSKGFFCHHCGKRHQSKTLRKIFTKARDAKISFIVAFKNENGVWKFRAYIGKTSISYGYLSADALLYSLHKYQETLMYASLFGVDVSEDEKRESFRKMESIHEETKFVVEGRMHL
jgi:hypothetical protein